MRIIVQIFDNVGVWGHKARPFLSKCEKIRPKMIRKPFKCVRKVLRSVQNQRGHNRILPGFAGFAGKMEKMRTKEKANFKDKAKFNSSATLVVYKIYKYTFTLYK